MLGRLDTADRHAAATNHGAKARTLLPPAAKPA
jgi:hypothetical protein